MKPNDIRKMGEADQRKKLDELTKELFNLKFQLATGRLENSAKLGSIRRDIARINTILTESRG
jgi:large subunit ribosomal protein L29